MAEKETNSTKNAASKATVKVTPKPATATAKPAATPKPATTAAKPAATPKPATTAAKTTATPKPATTAAKTTATPKPATATAKPAATPKPATATAKPAATPKPATTTVKPATAAKPAAAPAKAEVAATKSAPAEAKPKVAAAKVDAADAKPEKVKKEKPAKAVKTTEGGGSSAKAKVAAIVRTDNFRIFGIIGLSLILVLCLSLGLVFGLQSCTGMRGILAKKPITVNAYANTTKVGYSYQNVGTVQRNKPVEGVHDEAVAFDTDDDGNIVFAKNAEGNYTTKRYPTYGSTPPGYTGDANAAKRAAVVNESSYLCAWGTAGANRGGDQTPDKYTRIDKDGWLYQYKDGQWIHSLKWGTEEYTESNYRQLYKHSASVGLYLGDVSDKEPGIVKQVNLRPRGYSSYSVTGVYAPAGEVIKIQLSGADMNATGGISIHIGQALYNGQANNIWVGKNTMPRMAHVLTTLAINKSTAEYDEATDTWTGYVGSFLGGPIYVRNTNAEIKVTISGACAYRHFILGYTTEAEFKELSKSTVPYFDLEVWEYGVLHSGPVRYAQSFSYNDLYKAAVLWEKVSTVTTTNGTKQGIVFIYDPFVAAGAAVAFPGRSSVNCPLGWMSQSLNYNSMVTSGTWGNFHEYHHNFQNYGVSSGANGEVTNNGLNLVSYSLFTNISSLRQISGYGGAGLSGWNQYTSATWALNRVNNRQITSTNGLALYATLLHNFGQDQYIKARGTTNTNGYLDKWATNTHQDFTYYASQITDYGTGVYSPSKAVVDANYPLFVPVSSVYQTGRTYMYDGEKREINTMQPYVIPAEKPFTVDLRPYKVNSGGQYESGSIVIGNGFTYKIKGVKTNGINGTFKKAGEENVYTFTPNSHIRSEKIYVTLEIYYGNVEDGVRVYNGHKLDDVDLVLEFQQSREWNKNVLERTIYKFDEMKYTSATAAYEAGYAGKTGSETVDNKNYSQNSNTDIWLYPLSNKDNETFGQYVYTPNSVLELKGKLYFPEAGTYRIYMRGRSDCALYISRDSGKTYSLAAHIDRNDKLGTSAVFFPNNSKTYIDVSVKAEEWIYFKEVLIVEPIPNSNMVSYVGLGLGTWTVPEYTTEVQYYCMINGSRQNLAEEATEDGTRYYYPTSGSGTRHYVEQDGTRYYYDSNEIKVEEEKVGAVQSETHYYTNRNGNKVEVTAEQASNVDPVAPTSANYATAYRQSYEFQKQFESDYFYTRPHTYSYSYVETPSADAAILDTKNVDAYGDSPVQNLLTENGLPGTTGKFQVKSNKFPMEITVDLGQEVTANRVDLYGTLYNGNSYHPTQFYILVGNSPEDISTPFGPHWENVKSTTGNTGFSIDEAITFRYYKIVIEKWNFGAVQFRYIKFSYTIPGTANLYTPDDKMFTYKGNWKTQNCNSTFGHVYIGNKATMEFEFEGTRLAILSSNFFGKNYEVHIDGKTVSFDILKSDNAECSIAYLSKALGSGKHKVVIYCPDEGNIDSIAVW